MDETALCGELREFIWYALEWIGDVPASDLARLSGMPALDKAAATMISDDGDASLAEIKLTLRQALAWIDAVPKAMVDAFPAMPGFNRDTAEELLETDPEPAPLPSSA